MKTWEVDLFLLAIFLFVLINLLPFIVAGYG